MTSGACWTPFARLLEKEYDLIMPDARGHGGSSAPKNGYNYCNLAIDLLQFIEKLKLVDPILIGHSMGGMTAAVAAAQSPLVRGLILVDPTFLKRDLQWEVYHSDVKEQHRQILNGSKADFVAHRRLRKSGRSHELTDLLNEARFQTSLDAFEILRPPNPNYIDLIESLQIPSLLVIGESGAVVSPALAKELIGINQSLDFVQIKGVGHGIPFDRPKCLAKAAKIYLEQVELIRGS